MYAKNINQYVAPSKHSVNANHNYYSIIVCLSKCKFLVAVVSAFPDTDSFVFSSGYIVECPSRLDPQPSSPGYHPSLLWRPHSSCSFTCTSALVSPAILSPAGLWGLLGSVEHLVQHLALSIFPFSETQGAQSGNSYHKLIPFSTFYIKGASIGYLLVI